MKTKVLSLVALFMLGAVPFLQEIKRKNLKFTEIVKCAKAELKKQ